MNSFFIYLKYFLLILLFCFNFSNSFSQVKYERQFYKCIDKLDKKDSISIEFTKGNNGDIYIVQVIMQSKNIVQFKNWILLAYQDLDKQKIYLLYRYQVKDLPVKLEFESKDNNQTIIGMISFSGVDKINPFLNIKNIDYIISCKSEMDSIPLELSNKKNIDVLLLGGVVSNDDFKNDKVFDKQKWYFYIDSNEIKLPEKYNISLGGLGLGASFNNINISNKSNYGALALKSTKTPIKNLLGIGLILNPTESRDYETPSKKTNNRDNQLLDSLVVYNLKSWIEANIYDDLNYYLSVDLGDLNEIGLAKYITACEAVLFKNKYSADTLQVCKDALAFYRTYENIYNINKFVFSKKYNENTIQQNLNKLTSILTLNKASKLEARRLKIIELMNNYKIKNDDFIKEYTDFISKYSKNHELARKGFEKSKSKWNDYPYLMDCYTKVLENPEGFDLKLVQ